MKNLKSGLRTSILFKQMSICMRPYQIKAISIHECFSTYCITTALQRTENDCPRVLTHTCQPALKIAFFLPRAKESLV